MLPQLPSPDAPPWLHPRAAYIHVPFCAHHCGYCDFAVVAGQDHQTELYLDALSVEMAALRDPAPVRTVFIGGGTPTHLTPEQLARLLALVNRWLPHSERFGPYEFSVEANPDDLTPERVAVLADSGVNRLSIGVQSFQTRLLTALDRRHQPATVREAVQTARRRIAAVSLDLIFGVPGQTLADWRADLDAATALEPDHISAYGLTYEKGTPLWKAVHRGAVSPLDEELEREMFLAAMDRLGAAGFEHYEISNYARSGRRCRHNETYWANEAYHGFGVGAARYVGGVRQLNTRSLPDYLKRVLSGEPATFQSEELAPEDRARETLAVQLRRADGIYRTAFLTQTGFAVDSLAGEAIRRHVETGLLDDDGNRVRLTREGKCVADALVEDLFREYANGLDSGPIS